MSVQGDLCHPIACGFSLRRLTATASIRAPDNNSDSGRDAMKLCPQCEFIYEDDQSFCDMDGKELVYGLSTLAFDDNTVPTSSQPNGQAATTASLTATLSASQPTRSQFKWAALAALAGIIFVALLFVVYYARTHQPRSANANQASKQTASESLNEPAPPATGAQDPASDSAAAAPASVDPTPEQESAESTAVTASALPSLSPSPRGSINRGRLANPVSAGGSDNRAPVIVWLRNGSSIKADEAWEKKEGIWYRQAGMVTFLKRSQVRTIQRLAPANPRSKLVAINAGDKNRRAENNTAQNQPRVVKPQAAETKKESRMTSFLKRTGQILKKPFKL